MKYKLNWAAYAITLANMSRNHPNWRAGQRAFNALYKVSPDLANRIRGTEYDPFNRDERLEAFHEFINNHT